MAISKATLRYLRFVARSGLSVCNVSRPRLSRPRQLFRGCQNATSRRYAHSPADNPDFVSIVDVPARLVSSNRKHGIGLLVLAVIPVTAFALGSWQVQRLGWKTDLIARFEDRLVREPLPLPPTIDPTVIHEFDYRRVYTYGELRHDQEMLIGPRIHDGVDGFLVMTPLDRSKDDGSKILICRGWISREKKEQRLRDRIKGVPSGVLRIEGLLREPFKKNMFTPDNDPSKGQWYFPDIGQMAEVTGSQPVWIEETGNPDLLVVMDNEAKGIPIGRPAEVNLRNNHTQYIFTWYALSLATSIMFWIVARKPRGGGSSSNRVRKSNEW